MPLTPKRLEYAIDTGYINIVTDGGQQLPAYWAHPQVGNRFSGLAVLHDWWGVNRVVRLLANYFAQMGYYVIVPDMFNGRTASTPQEAMELLEATKETRFKAAAATLTVLEHHHRTTSKVAVIGLGMGGTLAFEAALRRTDIEAAVAYGGFPQAYLGQFKACRIPLLACYGSEEPYTKPVVINALRAELAASPGAAQHRVVIIPGAQHGFFFETPTEPQREQGSLVLEHTLGFLEQHLGKPDPRAARPVY